MNDAAYKPLHDAGAASLAYTALMTENEAKRVLLVQRLVALKQMTDAAEMLWVVLANVSEGDWTKQTPEWQAAAARWRDNYFAAIGGKGIKAAELHPDNADG